MRIWDSVKYVRGLISRNRHARLFNGQNYLRGSEQGLGLLEGTMKIFLVRSWDGPSRNQQRRDRTGFLYFF